MNNTTHKELAKAVGDFIDTVVLIADENECDRDVLIERAAETVVFVAQTATFKTYEPVESYKDKHWSECRQIALYDDQIKQQQDHIDRLKGVINALCGYMGGVNNG